ncbi:hypothetical protein GCM10027562_31510 [Arthrobacter pigmenti]
MDRSAIVNAADIAAFLPANLLAKRTKSIIRFLQPLSDCTSENNMGTGVVIPENKGAAG